MKISELTSKNFLNNAGAAANSYVLINYEDNSTSEPVTYKASLDTLGKAIAKNLNLMQNSRDNITDKETVKTVSASMGSGTYADSNTGWTKSSRSAILSFDPSDNTVGYYDDYHNTGYKVYEQTTINNQDIVVNTTNGLAISNGNGTYEPITKIDDKEMVLWNADSGGLLISDGNGGYEAITGNGDCLFAFASDGNLIDGNNEPITKIDNNPLVVYDSTSGTIKYYNAIGDEYVTISTGSGGGGVSLANPSIRIMNPSEAAVIGPSELYHLAYGAPDASAQPLYAMVDPWRIPGDENNEYSLVVCNNNTGALYKIVGPSDSDPYIEALTT